MNNFPDFPESDPHIDSLSNNKSDNSDISIDQKLLNDLNTQTDISIYTPPEENPEKSDDDLLSLSKLEIIQIKNYQILKLKTYIASLEKEKESLIADFKTVTDNLLSQIKQLEYQSTGFRPETPMIAKRFQKQGGVTPSDFGLSKQTCPNCKKQFPPYEYVTHTLDCLRKQYRCPKCDMMLEVNQKQKHFDKFKDIDMMKQAIEKKNVTYVKSAVSHGLEINETIFDNDKGDLLIHVLSRKDMISGILEEGEFSLDLKNKESKTALMIAIENKNQKSARELIVKGASVKERNKGDMSPLMIACKVGMNDIAEMLIKSGADVNEKNILGETPVKIAQINGNEELAMKLITTYKAGI